LRSFSAVAELLYYATRNKTDLKCTVLDETIDASHNGLRSVGHCCNDYIMAPTINHALAKAAALCFHLPNHY